MEMLPATEKIIREFLLNEFFMPVNMLFIREENAYKTLEPANTTYQF